MTSRVRIIDDLPKLLLAGQWLIDIGFSYRFENEYTLSFYKADTTVSVYYGRYSDNTDVLITINSTDSDRLGNGRPESYSVFEATIVGKAVKRSKCSDGFGTAQVGLGLLKSDNRYFDIQFLKDVRREYLMKIESY